MRIITTNLHIALMNLSIPFDNHSWTLFDGLHFKFDLLVTTFAVDLTIFHCTSHRWRRHSTIHNMNNKCDNYNNEAVSGSLSLSLSCFGGAAIIIFYFVPQMQERWRGKKNVSDAKCDWLVTKTVRRLAKNLFLLFAARLVCLNNVYFIIVCIKTRII